MTVDWHGLYRYTRTDKIVTRYRLSNSLCKYMIEIKSLLKKSLNNEFKNPVKAFYLFVSSLVNAYVATEVVHTG